jgi:hypothetical protein
MVCLGRGDGRKKGGARTRIRYPCHACNYDSLVMITSVLKREGNERTKDPWMGRGYREFFPPSTTKHAACDASLSGGEGCT